MVVDLAAYRDDTEHNLGTDTALGKAAHHSVQGGTGADGASYGVYLPVELVVNLAAQTFLTDVVVGVVDLVDPHGICVAVFFALAIHFCRNDMQQIGHLLGKLLDLLRGHVDLRLAGNADLRAKRSCDQNARILAILQLVAVEEYFGLVAFGGTDHGDGGGCVTGGCLNDCAACVQLLSVPRVAPLCGLDHGQRHAVFVAAAGIQVLQLNEYVCAGILADAVELKKRRVSDCFGDTVNVLHVILTSELFSSVLSAVLGGLHESGNFLRCRHIPHLTVG